jgi:hypothetical protein
MLGRIALLLAAAVLVSACGGGGGGDGGGGGGGGGLGGGGGGGGQDAFSLSSTSATFSATQGGSAPAPQTVLVGVNFGTVFIGTTQSGGQFSHVFQITGPTTGHIVITPAPPTAAGTFTGTITVRGCSTDTCIGGDVAGSPKIINVTYTVSGTPTLTSNPSTVDFQTSTGITPAAKTLNLSSSTGTSGWTRFINYTSGSGNWLDVSPAAAPSLPTTVTLNVTTVPPAGTHTAIVTFNAGGITRDVPVSLTVSDPRVNFVAPYVVTTATAGVNVILRGFGFSTLAAGTLQVQFGATPAVPASFVSDTEILATLPALDAGTYTISVGDGTLTLPTRTGLKLLVISAPITFAPVTIDRTLSPSPGFATNLIYDAERQALYLMDPENNRIERYQFQSGTTWTPASLETGGGGGNPRIALSPDGTQLLKTSGNTTTMSRIDLASFTPMSSADAASLLGLGAHLNLIAFGSDGGAVGSSFAPNTGISLYRYDMLTQQFAALSTQFDMTNRTIVASGNGDRIVLPTFEPLDPAFAKPVFTYDASSGTLTPAAVTTTNTGHASLSRDGLRMILSSAELSASQTVTVYNSSFTALGTLPPEVRAFVISPDGATAFAYFTSDNTIRKFDLNLPSGGGFTQISSTALPNPSVGPGTFFSEMTISPDGGTLFLAGNQRVIIVPAP